MAAWQSDLHWADDVAEEAGKPKKMGSFKASTGKFLPILMDLYNGVAITLEESDTFQKARDAVCEKLRGAIMLRAQVYDEKHVIRFELDSRI